MGQVVCGVRCNDRDYISYLEIEWRQQEDHESWCGSDAFYRDNYPKMMPKGSFGHDAREQVTLKTWKAEIVAEYALSSLKEMGSRGSKEFDQAPLVRTTSGGSNGPPVFVQRTMSGWKAASDWLGKTIPEAVDREMPRPREGPHWKKGLGIGLPVRMGPGYARKKGMTKSEGNLYTCLTVDAIRASVKMDEIIGYAVSEIPPPATGSTWTPKCPLPRVLCINVMLPYYNPNNPLAKDDGGCSCVGFFEINQRTIDELQGGDESPCVKLFRKFCEGPCGKPGGSLDDPDRCLTRRRDMAKKQDLDTGLFKAAGWCENEEELGVPEFLRQFNGKSFVIHQSGYVVKDPHGEWLEMGFDVRKFNPLFKNALYNFRNVIPKAQFHCGFSIQATEDAYLPEGLLCDMHLSGVNIIDHPLMIHYERVARRPSKATAAIVGGTTGTSVRNGDRAAG